MSKKQFRDFKSAREFVRKLELKNVKEWNEYLKSGNKPDYIPNWPDGIYKNKGWVGYGDWLGTGRVANQNFEYRDFESAREFTRKLKLKGQKEWKEYCKSGNKPDDIPNWPNQTYKNKGWKNIGDWLGTGNIASYNKSFREFESAKKFVRKLRLKNVKEWNEYLKSGNKPDDIPTNPFRVYKNKGWVSFGDFLGTGNIAPKYKKYQDLESAKKFVRKLRLKNVKEWNEYLKSGNKPDDIPNWPNQTYKNKGWVSFGDFLGTGRISDHKKIFRDFNLSKKFVKKLNLKNTTQWNAYCKSGNKPDDIPTNPQKIYKNNGWVDFADFLGSGLISNYAKSKQYLSFSEAREEARRLAKKFNIKTTSDWQNAVKKGWIPKNIPSNPSYIYPKKNIKKNVQRNN